MTDSNKNSNKNSGKNYSDIKINPLPEREVEIIGTISAEKMSLLRSKAIAKFRQDLELPGFRKGNAPETLVVNKIGEMRLLEEAAEMALQEEYPNILEDHKIDAIGRPEITITKIGLGNPLEFKIKTYLFPEVKLGDYKGAVANTYASGNPEAKKIEVNDKEVQDVILNIRQNIAHQKKYNEDLHSSPKQSEQPLQASSGRMTSNKASEAIATTDSDLPEVNDDFAKMIGGFTNLADMKNKIRENILAEKKLKEKDKTRVEILEAIITESQIDLPKIIIEGELDKMMAQFENDIAQSGVKMEDYLKHIKKTPDDLKKEWTETATKRAKSQIILNEIAKSEGISAKEEDIKKEVDHITLHHKDVDRFRARMYVETFLNNELVFKFLEGQ